MALIEFDRVSKIYRKGFLAVKVPAVVDLSFSVDENHITGFVGPNGAGKTTSLKMLMGLVHPTSGTIKIRGKSAPAPESRERIAFLSEQPYFYDHLTVRESLRFAYRLNHLPPADMHRDIDRVLQKVDLSDSAGKRVRELSKGMQQRLNMAQALLGDAHVFILDEPMSGLDPLGRTLFRSLFRELIEQGKSIFFSTHILDDIEQVCDRVVVLAKGRLTYQGEIAELLERGFLGTDVLVATLDAQTRDRLRALGAHVSDTAVGTSLIFVPRDHDVRACQKILYEKGYFPESITNRHHSLETILYGQGRSTESEEQHKGLGHCLTVG